ncbi:MAG: YggS family pyridoxal phosphate-dependent enzyme [Desulfuromonadaceae bacterium]|nr:YggS family pyridoxal phosphate-dependent enzyme [Desulfuromonadaceae bacterium]
MSITENLAWVRERMQAACARSGRIVDQVRLVAVSKTKPTAAIEEAAAAGQTIFGESYVQEFMDKEKEIREPVEWHFVGALQTNKVKYLAGKVAMIHSVDRLHLAKEISRQWGKIDRTIDLLVQVNLGHEATKAGTTEEDLASLVRQIASLPHLRIKGLMTLPPYCDDPEEVRPFFQELRRLARHLDTLVIPGVDMKELSMGMTHDFEAAIEEGATLIRVGTAIFGERQYKK